MKKIILSKQQVSTAIFNYLEGKGKNPNRKLGVKLVSVSDSEGQIPFDSGDVQDIRFSANLR